MTRIKICGITNIDDALMAIEAGADAISFIFVPNTPRCVDADTVANIVKQLPPFMKTIILIGVFANADQEYIEWVANSCHLDVVQLHGEETPDFCHALSHRVIKVVALEDESSLWHLSHYHVSAYMVDTKILKKETGYTQEMATGNKVLDWDLAANAQEQHGRIILAGGLDSDNVADAVRKVRPYGVDVVRGVEAKERYKDPAKVKAFIQAVREADLECEQLN